MIREVLIDNRGGERGLSRKYAPETKQQIIRIRADLEKEDSYFIVLKYSAIAIVLCARKWDGILVKIATNRLF